MEGFVVTCPLAPGVPHLLSGFHLRLRLRRTSLFWLLKDPA